MAINVIPKPKSRRGRQPIYTPERVAKIVEALERGETKETAAKLAGIHISTFYDWQNNHPDFLEAVKKAQEAFQEWEMNGILADARKSLKTLICGLEYEEVKTEYEQNPKDPTEPRIKKQIRVTKKILPNPTAVIFALCNRDPEHWKNRVENTLAGKIETENQSAVSLENVPDELLAKVIDAIRGE